eukprot:2196408-Prymnesium_polylepis.1
MLQNYHFDAADLPTISSAEAAALAELWSSYAQGFKYNPAKCELWCKPGWLKIWLRAAKER